jgi:hypothetical protein
LEDSLQNCLRLQPDRPKKDYVKLMENDRHILRYEATLVGKELMLLNRVTQNLFFDFIG